MPSSPIHTGGAVRAQVEPVVTQVEPERLAQLAGTVGERPIGATGRRDRITSMPATGVDGPQQHRLAVTAAPVTMLAQWCMP